jgi:hypothetical protein
MPLEIMLNNNSQLSILNYQLAFVFALLITGCASIIKGSYQEITVNSNVNGAIVELDGVEVGTTPFTGKAKKAKTLSIKVSKHGYASSEIGIRAARKNLFSSVGNSAIGVASGGTASFFFFDMSTSAAATTGGIAVSSGVFAAASSTDGRRGAIWEYSPSSYYVQLQAEGESSLDFENGVAIRYFAMMNHSQIAIDAGENQGEYLTALVNLMETKMSRDAAMQNINEALEKSMGNQLMFANFLYF